MKKNYGLTNTEMDLMNIFWDAKDPRFTFKELTDYTHTVLGKEWKYQTLGTYLSNLQRSGLLKVDTSGRNYIYYPSCSKEEYIHQWTKNLVSSAFDNSIFNFVRAFTGGAKLTKEEAEELKKLIE